MPGKCVPHGHFYPANVSPRPIFVDFKKNNNSSLKQDTLFKFQRNGKLERGTLFSDCPKREKPEGGTLFSNFIEFGKIGHHKYTRFFPIDKSSELMANQIKLKSNHDRKILSNGLSKEENVNQRAIPTKRTHLS